MSEVNAVPAKVQLTVSGILNDLNEGLTRDGIRSKYALTAKDVTDLFKHPKLKGKKTKPAPGFSLTDDTPDEEVVNEVVAETPAETQPEVVAETPVATDATTDSPAWEEPKEEVKVTEEF
jgi:hypothetical protein